MDWERPLKGIYSYPGKRLRDLASWLTLAAERELPQHTLPLLAEYCSLIFNLMFNGKSSIV